MLDKMLTKLEQMLIVHRSMVSSLDMIIQEIRDSELRETFVCRACEWVLPLYNRVDRSGDHVRNECLLCSRMSKIYRYSNTDIEFDGGLKFFRDYRESLGDLPCYICDKSVPKANENFYVSRTSVHDKWDKEYLIFLCSRDCAMKHTRTRMYRLDIPDNAFVKAEEHCEQENNLT